ncbi:hypothetical protein HM1_0964 [Heliomicrobium modesticaldum Ice1]|uniref:HEAT repeat domain-containing protein n=1 Tax=Heliobacterium modesticaldum (strain ATCC 51547 / Ice1) TaxID=498761 RepID=B0TA65_HELMI|nr:HEAT repeat domain-containing protein [Heliomicrobium modesticaldum]ABZ83602.1 hypothetical protein HM1_0964 [Heliomicrobium modesticaldum Ice1]
MGKDKEPFWRRWLTWLSGKSQADEPSEQVRHMLYQLREGIVPQQGRLTRLLAAPPEERSRWWQEVVQAEAARAAPSSPVWRLARILRLEEHWWAVMAAPQSGPKEQVIEAVGPLLLPEAIPLLQAAVLDRSPAVGLAATTYLAQVADSQVTDFFLGLLARPDGGPWIDRAARGLAARRSVDGPVIWRRLLAMTGDAQELLRIRAWEVLASFGPPADGEAVDNLEACLRAGLGDPEAAVRARAAETAGLLARGELAPELVEAVRDADARVRAEAARALGRLAALNLLDRGHNLEQRKTSAALCEAVRQALTDCLADEDYRVSGCARQALHYIAEA